MAKSKSTGKNKRDKSASLPKTTTRKKQIASSLASPVEETTATKSTKTRVRKTKSDVLESDGVSPVKRPSRRAVKTKDANALKVSPASANDVAKKRGSKGASSLKKDDGDLSAARKTVRQRSDSTISESVDDSKKKPVAQKADILIEKKKRGKTPKHTAKTAFVAKDAPETTLESREPVRSKRQKATSDEPSEKIVKPRTRKNGKVASQPDFSLEATPAEKKNGKGKRVKNVETRLSESDVAVVNSDEKSRVKRDKKRGVKSIEVAPSEISADANPTRRKTRRLQKASQSNETAEDGNELLEIVPVPPKKRVKKAVVSDVADESSQIDVKSRKKRSKETDLTDTVEKKRGTSRRQKREAEEKSQGAAPLVVDADDDSNREPERNLERNDSQATSEDAAKKEETSRSETDASRASRPAARRKSSSASRTQNGRVLSNQSPDYLVLSAVNSFWLCAQWVVSDSNLNRVRSAMGRLWHTSEPVLRVYRVDKSSHFTTVRREHISDVVVKLPVRIWYAPVDNPPSSFMVELGYLSRDGEFFTLSSSGVVETSAHFIDDSTPLPPPIAPRWGIAGSTLRSPFGTPSAEKTPSSSDDSDFMFRRVESTDSFNSLGGISLKVGAEVVIKGRVTPGAILKIRDERVVPKPNGFFAARLELPERRHVYPIVATSYDGSETQTIILAIDRNTKTLETVFRDEEE